MLELKIEFGSGTRVLMLDRIYKGGDSVMDYSEVAVCQEKEKIFQETRGNTTSSYIRDRRRDLGLPVPRISHGYIC